MKTDTKISGEDNRDEWVHQIYNFRDNCQTELKVHEFSDDQGNIIQNEINDNQLEEAYLVGE